MATVGNLFINVKAKTASFSKKMKGVRATIGRLGAGLVKAGKKVALFGAAMAALAVGGITALTKRGLESVDMVGKLAKALSTSTEGIIALQHAAKLGGVSVEKMDKAIGKMFKNVGEVAQGLGMAKKTLDDLGLSAIEIGKLDADEMFGVIAEELSKVENAAIRAKMANDIFGRAGIELLPVLLDGADGIRGMRKEAEELGITFGIKQAQMVEEANDAWARIGSVWKGLTQQLAINFAPILIEIAERIKAFVVNAGGMTQVAEFIVKGFMFAGAAVLDVIKAIEMGWIGLKAGVIQIAADITNGMAVAAQATADLWADAIGAIDIAIGGSKSIMAFIGGSFVKGGFADPKNALLAGLPDIIRGTEQINKTIKSEAADTLNSIAESLQGQATDLADNLLSKLAEGWHVGKVPQAFEDMIAKHLGEGFKRADTSGLQLEAPDLKAVVNNLQTAIGGFKVEGDRTHRLQQEQLSVEKNQLRTLEQMKQAMAIGVLI